MLQVLNAVSGLERKGGGGWRARGRISQAWRLKCWNALYLPHASGEVLPGEPLSVCPRGPAKGKTTLALELKFKRPKSPGLVSPRQLIWRALSCGRAHFLTRQRQLFAET